MAGSAEEEEEEDYDGDQEVPDLVETKSCPIWEEGKSCPTWKEGIEFMPILRSLVGKERKKIATQDEAIVAGSLLANSRSELKRSREEGKRFSSGLKEKKARSKKKAKRSSEVFLLFPE